MSNLRYDQVWMIVSLKGGVGKSTVSASLAYWLSNVMDFKVGLWDLDITSPSIPKIFGCQGKELGQGTSMIEPYPISKNLSIMSLAFMLEDDDQPIVWHGDRKAAVIRQFMKSTDFGKLNYLVLDTPPTTSEELLTTLELFPKRKMNIIFVTQPSEVSENSVRKSIRFLTEQGWPIRGLVSNMSTTRCTHCGDVTPLFGGTRNVESIADKYGIPFLGEIHMGESTVDDLFVLNGTSFTKVAERIYETSSIKIEERFSERNVFRKGILAHQMMRKFKKENIT